MFGAGGTAGPVPREPGFAWARLLYRDFEREAVFGNHRPCQVQYRGENDAPGWLTRRPSEDHQIVAPTPGRDGNLRRLTAVVGGARGLCRGGFL